LLKQLYNKIASLCLKNNDQEARDNLEWQKHLVFAKHLNEEVSTPEAALKRALF